MPWTSLRPRGLSLDWLEEPQTAVGVATLLLGTLWLSLCVLRVRWPCCHCVEGATYLSACLLAPPIFVCWCSFLSLFVGAFLLEWFLFVVSICGTFFGLKGFFVVVYYNSVLDSLLWVFASALYVVLLGKTVYLIS
jgi:hypothetical protein